MNLNILTLFLLLTSSLVAQEKHKTRLSLEGHYGFNANAYTSYDIAQPFLDEGFGRNYGLDVNFIFPIKTHLFQISGSSNVISLALSPANLIYEFEYDYDNECCYQLTNFYTYTGGLKYVYPFYKTDKLEVLGAVGANINFDIYVTGGWATYEDRRLWYQVNKKNETVVFASFDLSTRIIYHTEDRFSLVGSLTFVNAPFYTLDSEYLIDSRKGVFSGEFHQKLSSFVIGLGLGIKL